MSITAAFFDVDGTLVKTNAIEHYLSLSKPESNKFSYACLMLSIILKIPYYILLDKISRQLFNQVFYRNYCKFSPKELEQRSQIYFQETLKSRIFAESIHTIKQHQNKGDLVILVTGSLDFIIKPLAHFLNIDTTITTTLQVKDGLYNGQIKGVSPVGKEKANAIYNLSQKLDIDLSQSYAYGDSISDLSMLTIVSNPIVVNPDYKLKKIAVEKGWPVKVWCS